MTAPDPTTPYPVGAPVWVDLSGTWYRGHVVPVEHPERLGWWPGVDFRRAVAIRLAPGSGFAGAGRGSFDVLVPDPASDKLMPRRQGGAAPRTALQAVTP